MSGHIVSLLRDLRNAVEADERAEIESIGETLNDRFKEGRRRSTKKEFIARARNRIGVPLPGPDGGLSDRQQQKQQRRQQLTKYINHEAAIHSHRTRVLYGAFALLNDLEEIDRETYLSTLDDAISAEKKRNTLLKDALIAVSKESLSPRVGIVSTGYDGESPAGIKPGARRSVRVEVTNTGTEATGTIAITAAATDARVSINQTPNKLESREPGTAVLSVRLPEDATRTNPPTIELSFDPEHGDRSTESFVVTVREPDRNLIAAVAEGQNPWDATDLTTRPDSGLSPGTPVNESQRTPTAETSGTTGTEEGGDASNNESLVIGTTVGGGTILGTAWYLYRRRKKDE